MIPKEELLELRAEWQLDAGVIEKDYVLGWLLAAIANDEALAETWTFKGGTCLRKCYFETYRLSEDLDFTVTQGGPETPEALTPIFARVSDWLETNVGIQILLDGDSFTRKINKRGNPTTQGRISYRGPNPPPTLPKVKLDLTSDEIQVETAELRTIGHPFSDAPLPGPGVRSYSLVELCGEKIRALEQRCRPRDLYDIVHMSRHPDLFDEATAVAAVLAAKCAYAEVDVPDLAAIHASPFRAEIETEWEHMLGHQLPDPLVPFDEFWAALDGVFAWLKGEVLAPVLLRAELPQDDLDSAWVAPRAMTSWRTSAPLELVRYAGANRLKVELDYRAKDGRHGPRIVEPYSLRRTKDGFILLFVVNDRGKLRAYRADRIAAVRPTNQTFNPRYLVEF